MDKNKRQLYFTFAEQEQRLKSAMPEILTQYRKFQEAKKNGKLKIEEVTKEVRLFDI